MRSGFVCHVKVKLRNFSETVYKDTPNNFSPDNESDIDNSHIYYCKPHPPPAVSESELTMSPGI